VSVEIEVTMESDLDDLSEAQNRAENLHVVATRVEEIAVKDIQENFDRGGPADGEAWEPSKRVLRHGGQTLVKSGNLKASIRLMTAAGNTITVGSDAPYAANVIVGQPGAFPGRDFMDPSEEALDEVAEAITDYVLEGRL
jgi:phage gpG-like protein